MIRLVVIVSVVLMVATPAAADEDSKTLDLVARPNQLPAGFAEYGTLIGFPAGPEFDPPVPEWKYAGMGAWITATAYARVGVSDKVEVDGQATIAANHPENGPRANRFGGVRLAALYKLADSASVRIGADYIDPWLAMYGLTTFQHYYPGSKPKLAVNIGGRLGATVNQRVRLQSTLRLTVVPLAVDDDTTKDTWLLGELGARAETRVYEDFFAGLRIAVRTGDNLSPDPAKGATVPIMAQLRYVATQVDLGIDVGLGSALTSTDLMSRVAYAELASSLYVGVVINWRLDGGE